MYEYIPNPTKRAERTVFLSLLFLGLCLFGFSSIPYISLPTLYRALGILSVSISLAVHSRYLRLSYRYRVEPRPDRFDAPLDLVVVECLYRRRREVLRISVDDIREIIPNTKQNKPQIRAHRKGTRYFDLSACLFPAESYFLIFEDGDSLFSVRILADERLLELLKQ